jgi:colanic acid/amylovoran biosynthesis glycosyltransferase
MTYPMHVLHSTSVWLPQTQTWIHGQLAELQRLGVDAQVACERRENPEQFGIAGLHCLGSEHPLEYRWSKVLRRLGVRHYPDHLVRVGKAMNADILHSHFGHVGWANLGAARRLGARHVVTFYGFDVNKLPQSTQWQRRYRQLFAEADLFLCEGSHMAGCLVGLGCPPHKVKVQHLGVDVAAIDFRPRQWQPGEPLRVLVAATFTEKKGIPYAIEALGQVAQDIPVELTLLGDAREDAATRGEKRRILDLLESTGLLHHTRRLGFQPHEVMVREAYRHHLFLQPSVTAADGDTEGGAPVSIIEMLASGMPVVATRHCDIPEVMGKALEEMLAPERDVPALADRIRALLAVPGRWEQIARVGRNHVESQYDRKRQGECLRAHYEILLKDKEG